MDLGNKFIDVLYNEVSASKIKKQCETICDEFSIGFAEWIDVQVIENPKMYYDNSTKELLQIYKDENKKSK